MPMGVLETTKACPHTSQQPLTMLNIVAADNAHQFSAQLGKQVCSVHHTIRVIVCVDGVWGEHLSGVLLGRRTK